VTSNEALKELNRAIRERLLRHGHLTLSGIGTFRVESITSRSDPLDDQTFILHPPKKRIVLQESSATTTDPSLISELASNLGISPEESAAVIDLLTQEMVAQVPVEIPEFGIFTRSEGQLQFSADPKLLLSIPESYAGMDSIEIAKLSPTPATRKPFNKKLVWIIVALNITIAVGIWGYRMIQTGNEPAQQIAIPLESPAVLPVLPDSISSDSASNLASLDSLVEDNIDESVEIPSDPQPDSDIRSIDRNTGGYTIILGSFETPERALSLVEQYRKIYPDLVVDTLVNINNRYRVAIGQTPTISEAVSLKNRLLDIPSSAWVKNILNDSF